ncbi:MAG: alpha-ketoacid dehydrogenase subunit beta, partial [Pirellulaceae bacterium]
MKTYIEATREALAEELAADDRTVVFGRDIGPSGGVFRSTSGLIDVFGKDRIRSFPLGDHVLVGAAIGAALAGLRPIIDLISP